MGGYVHYYHVNEKRGNIGSRHGISLDAGVVEVHLGRQVHIVEWVKMTRTTSKSEDLRLQGDQPQRGLHAAAGGIQGISPIGTTTSCSQWNDQES